MTPQQRERLADLCRRYSVPFREADYLPAFDLPAGWVSGWVGGNDGMPGGPRPYPTIFVGVSPEGDSHS